MNREILKTNALELIKKSTKPSNTFISNGFMINELKRYRNEYTSIKNRTEEEDKILYDLEEALKIESNKPHYISDETVSNSEAKHTFIFSDNSRNDNDR